ncbi:hypothetical protein KCU95_g13461, partial [Aureobasidium melanogenum]
MSHDLHKIVGQRFDGHYMATANPFSLPTRPISQWDDARDRTSEQLHESAMYQLGLVNVPSSSTSTSVSSKTRAVNTANPFEAMQQKWEERGWLIQKHERRLKDSNELLSKMWRRLDPYGRVLELLDNNTTVRRHAERHAEPAFSENASMQEHFCRLAAYDYLYAIDPSFAMPPPATQADPALNEKRLKSLVSTVKIQSGLLQEKNETIEKLRTQLETQRRSHFQQFSAYQKDRDDTVDRLEKQLQKANTKYSRLKSAAQAPPKSKAIVPLAPRSHLSHAPIAKPSAAKAPVVKLPETAFGGAPENHTSLTFEGFSEHNTFNPARLLMLTAVNPPAEHTSSLVEEDFNRRYDSAMQRSRNSQAPTPMSSHWSSNGDKYEEHIHIASKRDVTFLDYDDPEDKPEENPKDPKRLKSDVLTPPLPEDLVMASTAESGDGVSVKHETDLEMGEIKEGGDGNKLAYEDLDEMINQAQKEAMN